MVWTIKISNNKHRNNFKQAFRHLFVPQSWHNRICHSHSNLNSRPEAGSEQTMPLQRQAFTALTEESQWDRMVSEQTCDHFTALLSFLLWSLKTTLVCFFLNNSRTLSSLLLISAVTLNEAQRQRRQRHERRH